MRSIRDIRHRSVPVIAVCAFAFILTSLVGGCGIFSPNEVPPDGDDNPNPDPFPLAISEEILIANLVRAYNERNDRQYDEMLDTEFVFYFAPDEIDDLGVGASWNRTQDVRSTTNMFTSQPGQKPDGEPQAPVQRINLVLVEDDPGVPWTDQVGDQFAGTTMKRYRVEMDVFYSEGNPNEVIGLQEFYAVPVQIEGSDGTAVTIFKLKYWRDLGKDQV